MLCPSGAAALGLSIRPNQTQSIRPTLTTATRTFFLVKDLLDELQTERFELGTGTALRVQELLSRLPDDVSEEDLRLALTPILAKSPREQALVYEKFALCQRRANELFGERIEPTTAPTAPIDPKIEPWKRWVWLAAAALLGLLAWWLWEISRPGVVPVVEKEFAANSGQTTLICPKSIPELDTFGREVSTFEITSPKPSRQERNGGITGKGEGVNNPEGPNPAIQLDFARFSIQNDTCLACAAPDSARGMAALVLRVNFSNGKNCDLRLRIFVSPKTKIGSAEPKREVTILLKKPIPYDHTTALQNLKITPVSPRQKWLAENWPWFRWLLLTLFAALLYLGWRLWEFYRRKLVADLDKFNQPPYVWRIKVPGADEGIVAGDDYQNLLQILRRRAATDTLRLDLPRSIRATVERGGIPSFKFRPATQPVDYLFLLDRQTEQNHRAQLFDALFRSLRAQELYVERFFYDSDLRVCHNEAHPEGLRLADVAQRFGQARLIVVGTGLQLINPFDGRMASWADDLFRTWAERALLTPRPLADWGRNERRLAELFHVFPATLQSLGFWADELQHGDDARFEGWRERVQDAPGAILQPDDEMPLPLLLLQFPREIVRWVAACAIFPGLHWELTLWLGRHLETLSLQNQASVTLENLLKIFRIRWFVEGQIPDTARLALLDWLEKEDATLLPRLRFELATLLETNQPPENSAAWIDHRLAVVANRWAAETDKKKRRELENELAELLPKTTPDVATLKYLDAKPSPLHFEVPPRLRKYVYRGGFRALGFSGGVWSRALAGVLGLLGLAFVLLWKPVAPDDGCRGGRVDYVFENQRLTLCLSNTTDSVLWLERRALDSLKARNFAGFDSVSESFQAMLASRNLPESKESKGYDSTFWAVVKRFMPPDTLKHSFANISADLYNIGVDFADGGQKDSACLFFQKAIGWDASGQDYSKEITWCNPTNQNNPPPLPPPSYPCRQIANVQAGIGFRNRPLSQAQFDEITDKPTGRLHDRTSIGIIPPGSQVDLLDSTALAWKVQFGGKTGWIAKFRLNKPTLVPCGRAVPPAATALPTKDGGPVAAQPNAPETEQGLAPGTPDTSKAAEAFALPEMVFVKGGTFQMGCPDEKDPDCGGNEKPAHAVTLSDYSIGKTELTVAQYMAFVNETKSHYPEWQEVGSKYNVKTGTDNHYKTIGDALTAPNNPIVGISWNDAVAYCQWLSKKTGDNYRLPTEAEWEFAARGAKTYNPKAQEPAANFKYAGSNNLDEVGWYSGNSDSKTHPVAQKKANELGLFDMSGNVWEWCADWYDEKYYEQFRSSAARNPTGAASGLFRVLRGGSWSGYGTNCRVSDRNWDLDRLNGIGFRVARH